MNSAPTVALLTFLALSGAANAHESHVHAGAAYGPWAWFPHDGRAVHHAQLRPKRRRQRQEIGVIPPSVAAKIAQEVVGGKILAVRLRGRFYIVKLRGQGRLFRVRVNAFTGRVQGR